MQGIVPVALRGVRRGPRHRGGRAAAPDPARHRRHPGRVHRGAGAGRRGPPGALPDRGDHVLQPDQRLGAGPGILGARQRRRQQGRSGPGGAGSRRQPERPPQRGPGGAGERSPGRLQGAGSRRSRDRCRAPRRMARGCRTRPTSPRASRRRASGSSPPTSRSAGTGRSSRSRPSFSWRWRPRWSRVAVVAVVAAADDALIARVRRSRARRGLEVVGPLVVQPHGDPRPGRVEELNGDQPRVLPRPQPDPPVVQGRVALLAQQVAPAGAGGRPAQESQVPQGIGGRRGRCRPRPARRGARWCTAAR